MISVTSKGSFDKTEKFLKRAINGDFYANLDRFGREGVNALAKATPVDTSLTAHSWSYKVIKSKKKPGIVWFNSNSQNGTSVAILIQYGHGTRTGGYVHGKDYINPAMRPVFDRIAQDIWKQVKA